MEPRRQCPSYGMWPCIFLLTTSWQVDRTRGMSNRGSKTERWGALAIRQGTLEDVCDRVATGETIHAIAGRWDVPEVMVWKWLWSDEKRRAAYERAQELAAYRMMEEIVQIADGVEESSAAVAKARLRIDVRGKLAAAHARERYGREDRDQRSGGGGIRVIVQRAQEGHHVDTSQAERHDGADGGESRQHDVGDEGHAGGSGCGADGRSSGEEEGA